MSRVAHRSQNLDKRMNMYGTTLRVWDTSIRAWCITWINPAGDHYEEHRWTGKDVVQIGAGLTGEALNPDGRTWNLEGDFCVTRMR